MSPLVRAAGLACALLAGAVVACGDRLVTVDDLDSRTPACMLMIGTLGYWNDHDTAQVIQDLDGYVVASCMCLRDDEFDDDDVRAQMSEMLFDECESLSLAYGFDSDECEEDYLSNAWAPYVWWADGGDVAHHVPASLPCK